ncbi:hypothetical protein ACQKEX_14850 [Bacillus pumilus]|uniref:hypothetical protein n=1 Tax=Bacillus TaxID=1386 RepID=UPI001C24AA5B|nr:hypothetical protein [Bacillus pumilus]MBU8576389.1 hypothetical protein [Bacillus pumilus]
MGQLSDSTISAIISVIGMVATGFAGYLQARRKASKDDRQLLSEDERLFRAELRELAKDAQERVKALTARVEELNKANLELVTTVGELKRKNDNLTREVSVLTAANNRLSEEVRRYREGEA